MFRLVQRLSILTFKVKHGRDFSVELAKARQIAEFAVRTRTTTSKDVKHIGLKAAIANQILRKYGRNRKAKKVSRVNLTVPGLSIHTDIALKRITIRCLKMQLSYHFSGFEKVNQIEIDRKYAYVSVTVPEELPETYPDRFIGIDLNTTGHVAVVSNNETCKIWKLGKEANHIALKYREIRRQLSRKGKYKKVKQIKNRQQKLIKNLNHHISKKIVQIARDSHAGIRLEKLTNIRQRAKSSKSFRYSLNNWSFYQLQRMIEYKAKLQGILVSYIDPRYTSKTCSKCGHIGDRDGKRFKCPNCGHVDHADANASFNIGKPVSHCILGRGRSCKDRLDLQEGSTDTPKTAPLRMIATIEPHIL